MDRYQDLDLDLECDGESGVQKNMLFRGMFKKYSKSGEQLVHAEESLSTHSELSTSDENVNDSNNIKNKGGLFKGMFKKITKTSNEDQTQNNVSEPSELSGSNNDLSTHGDAELVKSKIIQWEMKERCKPPPVQPKPTKEGWKQLNTTAAYDKLKQGQAEPDDRQVKEQEKSLLKEAKKEEEATERPEKAKVTKPKKQNPFLPQVKARLIQRAAQAEPVADRAENEGGSRSLFDQLDDLREEPAKREGNQESLSTHSELSKSDENLDDSNNIKNKGGLFKGMFKKITKTSNEDQTQNNVSEPSELSGSNNDLSTHGDAELVKSKIIQWEMKDRCKPPVQPKPTKEGWKQLNTTAAYDKLKQGQAEDTQAEPDDRQVKEQEKSSSKEEKKEEEATERPEKAKVTKPKKQNPFLPQVKARLIQRAAQAEPVADRAENEGGSRSLFDQLDDLREEPAKREDNQDVDLMEWWNTVEPWEEVPRDDHMTEKEEAKAFAVTADKVQKGIRLFNKLFSERAESLWQHVMDLISIADALDKFNKNTKIAQITGGSTSAIGGIATIAGFALAPVTMGTSLIVTAVGLGVATAGGLTSAGAGISNQVNNSMDRKKVEKIVEDYKEKIQDLNKCLKFIQQGIENLRKFDLIKMKQHAYNQDFPVLTSSFYEDGAMAGKAILTNANEIMRVVQIAHVAGSTAARAVQVASMATGVLAGLFVGMDIYFVAKDSKELKKGAKSEFAGKIRQVATQLHDGLVELNGIRVELQSSTQSNEAGKDKAASDSHRKDDDEEEDEVDRIKKDLKKRCENQEYV